MATQKQLEKQFGPFHDSDDIYAIWDCGRCREETYPENGHFLFEDENGEWYCPIREGWKGTDIAEVPGRYQLFGAACARRLLKERKERLAAVKSA